MYPYISIGIINRYYLLIEEERGRMYVHLRVASSRIGSFLSASGTFSPILVNQHPPNLRPHKAPPLTGEAKT